MYKSPTMVKEETPVEGVVENKPYVITPEEFSEGEYNTVTLNYYTDRVLADDDYNVVKDIKGTIGEEALNAFGLYEEDVVYVRNEKYQIDYEILLDERAFCEVAPKGIRTTYPGDDD